MTANHYQTKHSAKYGTLFTERMRLALVAVPVSALLSQKALLTYMVVNVPCAIQNQVLSLVLQFIADAQLPLEQRAHFYTGASPVCALCEAGSPNTRIFGLFCVTPFRTRGCTPCAAKRLSLRTCYLRTILTNHSQIASMIERSIYEARHGACSAHSFEN